MPKWRASTDPKDYTKDQLSLLLFLETRAVDYGGRVNTIHMNNQDMTQAVLWDSLDFIEFGRIVASDHNKDGTHWVRLSPDAWDVAHRERQARAARMWAGKQFKTTKKNSVA